MDFLPYATQTIESDDIEAVTQALLGDRITRGKNVEAFEREICERVGCQYAVAFSNGSAALWGAFLAADVTAFDRVITSPNTFIASVSGAMRFGARVRLVDIDPFGNIDIEKMDDEVNRSYSRGRNFVVPVHFAGVAVDMDKLAKKIRVPEVVVIEDAAHALGSLYPNGTVVGSCANSDMTVLSFHAVKNITCGEGGMVTTNDETLYKRLQRARNSGIERESLANQGKPEPWYYEVTEVSVNSHMTEMQAALGRSQLRKIDRFREKKQHLVSAYRKKLQLLPGVELFDAEPDSRTMYHLFLIKVAFQLLERPRSVVMEELQRQGIGSQYHYVPLYRHPIVQQFCQQTSTDFPQMEEYYSKALSIPLFAKMEEKDVDRVAVALRKALFQLG
jgi:dTDP-4-amino-4,6-dideoxygalactose transaminase